MHVDAGRLAALAALALTAAPLLSQETARASRLELALRDRVIPLHREANGEVWGGARTYKASFTTGMALYVAPADTRADRPVCIRWTTTAVHCAGPESADAVPLSVRPTDPTFSDRACRLPRAGLTEVYELRSDGVAQSFEIERRPADGDLAVVGRVEAPLSAEPRAPVHGSIVFRDGRGRAVLDYGAAFVIDAAGRREPIPTGWDGQEVRLVVPDAWLDDAVFPIVIDPLVAPRTLPLYHPSDVDIVHLPGTTFLPFLVTGTRTFLNDSDAFAMRTDANLTNARYMFTEVSTSVNTRVLDATYVGGARRWLIVGTRTGGVPSTQFLYAQDLDDLGFGTGDRSDPTLSSLGFSASLGGVRGSGTNALMAAGEGTTAGSQIEAFWIDVRGSPRVVANRILDRTPPGLGAPAVNPIAGSTADGWLVAYRRLPYDIELVRLDGNGGIVRRTTLTTESYAREPRFSSVVIAGESDRYLLAWSYRAFTLAWNSQAWARRVDTDGGFSLGTPKAFTVPTYVSRIGGIAYDTDTRSHWCIVHHEYDDRSGPRRSFDKPTQVTRIGHTGGAVETLRFNADGIAFSDAAYDPVRNRFAIVSTDQPNLLGRFLEHSSQARNYVYGTACAGGSIFAGTPYAGSEFWRVYLSDPSAGNRWGLLRVSPRAEDLPLGSGFGSCRSYVDTTIPVATHYFTSLGSTGFGSVDVPLPDDPALLGFLFCQWLYPDTVSGSSTFVTTAGLAANVQP